MKVLNDFNTTVQKALGEIDPKWRTYEGLIVCGTHTPVNVEHMLREIQEARENHIPFLGICFGYQLAWIEYCRNILGIKDATSAEFSEKGTFVVKKRDKLKVGLHDGETWWSNYYCDTSYDTNWTHQRGFFAVPFHPEYQSSKSKPHAVLVDFLTYAKNK